MALVQLVRVDGNIARLASVAAEHRMVAGYIAVAVDTARDVV